MIRNTPGITSMDSDYLGNISLRSPEPSNGIQSTALSSASGYLVMNQSLGTGHWTCSGTGNGTTYHGVR